ncbi:N-acetylmuramoyl-L-alanine amidase family protein, partial [Sporosarcina contaminans]
MAYAIINNYIDRSLYPLKSPYEMKPEYITIHNTYNDATALNEIAYMHRNKTATSYHVAIDDKHAVQAIPFNRNAWHAGDGQGPGNRKSIGIEICYSKSGGPKYAAAEANAIEYIAHVLKQYGWGIDRVKWHRDWSGKKCPHRIIDEGRLQEVKNRIAAKLAQLNGVASTQGEKEVDEMAQTLPKTQQDDMRALLKRAYTDKVFSVDHSTKVDKMTRG